MTKPIHTHLKDPAGLARPRRPLKTCAHLSQGHSLDTRTIPGSVAGAELEYSCGCDLPACERSSELLRALISALFMGWMPCYGVDAVRVRPRVTG